MCLYDNSLRRGSIFTRIKPGLMVCLTTVLIIAALLSSVISPVRADSYQLLMELVGKATGDNFGSSVASAGDVNNDGYDDLLVGARFTGDSAGSAYVYFLGVGPYVDDQPDLILQGQLDGEWFGQNVASAGDVNNDGKADVIVGAAANGNGPGRAYVFFGCASQEELEPPIVCVGEASGDHFGISVSTAGRVNADQYDDFLVGASHYDEHWGRVYIFYGGSSPDSIADITIDGPTGQGYFGGSIAALDWSGNLELDLLISAEDSVRLFYGGPGMDLTSDAAFREGLMDDEFGSAVASAGDMDNDGDDEVIIGAFQAENWGPGRAYVYNGGPVPDTTADHIFSGEVDGDWFGRAVGTAGDANMDGYDDVFIAAANSGAAGESAGRAYVFYSIPPDPEADITFTGEAANDHFGYPNSIASIENVLGDGRVGMIVGAVYHDETGDPNDNTGKVYIFASCEGHIGQTYLVNSNGTGDFPTIQNAIDHSCDSDIIELSDGIYTGDGNRDIDFSGKAITVRSQSGNPEACIINCEGSESSPHRGFHFHSGEDTLSIVESITITNGLADSAQLAPLHMGGAILCDHSSPTLINNILSNSKAVHGGGICCFESSPAINNNYIYKNWATSGGGIALDISTPRVLRGNVIAHNTAGYFGGGIVCVSGSDPEIVSNTIVANTAADSTGGGIFCYWDSHPTVSNTILWGNHANNDIGNDLFTDTGCSLSIYCSDFDMIDGWDGGGVLIQPGPNMYEDPLFCGVDVYNPNSSVVVSDFTLHGTSPCDEENSWWFGLNGCGLIGALPEACYPTSLAEDDYVRMRYDLTQNYPNPFNPSTTISYTLPKPCTVLLCVYDMSGRLIHTLINAVQKNSGEHEVMWCGETNTGRSVASGTYFYRLIAGKYTETRRMVLVR